MGQGCGICALCLCDILSASSSTYLACLCPISTPSLTLSHSVITPTHSPSLTLAPLTLPPPPSPTCVQLTVRQAACNMRSARSRAGCFASPVPSLVMPPSTPLITDR